MEDILIFRISREIIVGYEHNLMVTTTYSI